MTGIRNITLLNPSRLVFGSGSFENFILDTINSNVKRLFVLSVAEIQKHIDVGLEELKRSGCEVLVDASIKQEPSFKDYNELLLKVNDFNPEMLVGIGGGSVLDTAKLLAATAGTDTAVKDFLADKCQLSRKTKLICLPTTSGTGSEVSPNAIFFDPETGGKVGVIDPSLVPDAAYIDPALTLSVPPPVTATTGLDALTHCIEAYVNKFANPVTDLLALEGIRRIGRYLEKAYDHAADMAARENVALGSVYGGMCLGPVNTAAVHALAYPLGSSYKIAHGVSNAMLLPHVLEFNLDHAVEKYAKVARALGVDEKYNDLEAAKEGISRIKEMIAYFKIPGRLSELNINENEIGNMAHSALKIQRLLKNNVREVRLEDAVSIYRKAM